MEMTSKKKIDHIIRLLSDRFRLDMMSENVEGWRSVLESMTSAETVQAEIYLNHEFRGEWPPQPGDFKAWGTERQTKQLGPTAKTGEPFERVPPEEAALRIKTINDIFTRKIHRKVNWKDVLAALHRRSEGQHRWLRGLLGWTTYETR